MVSASLLYFWEAGTPALYVRYITVTCPQAKSFHVLKWPKHSASTFLHDEKGK